MESKEINRKAGRPPKPVHKKQSESIMVRVTLCERDYLRAECLRQGDISLSELVMQPWRERIRKEKANG